MCLTEPVKLHKEEPFHIWHVSSFLHTEIMSTDLLEELMSSEGKADHESAHLYLVYY